ncbi:MAG TPA: hypothetical protein VFW60_08725 [Rhodanobacteraceae bacterium]|nr:hypothetical protein [Rhodanobacteraceae bacterium]
MRLSTLCAAALLAAGSIGFASATTIDVIHNGDFSQTNNGTSVPTQFGTGSGGTFTAQQFITDWTGNDGYEIWYPTQSAATSDDAYSVWGQGSGRDTGKEMLWGPIPAPNGTLTFVGLDGDQATGVQSSIKQQLTGLTVGSSYTVSFDWGAAQLQSRTGATQSSLLVSFGDHFHYSTGFIDNPSGAFTGWNTSSFNFVADSTSDWLTFLAIGTPSGYPPVSLLTNVSVTHNVPEPPALAMFGLGLLGLGLLTVFARRRAQRRLAEVSHDDIA